MEVSVSTNPENKLVKTNLEIEVKSNLPQKFQPTPVIQALKPKKASGYNLITYLVW